MNGVIGNICCGIRKDIIGEIKAKLETKQSSEICYAYTYETNRTL